MHTNDGSKIYSSNVNNSIRLIWYYDEKGQIVFKDLGKHEDVYRLK
jgi:plasmid maintenance system killer protein